MIVHNQQIINPQQITVQKFSLPNQSSLNLKIAYLNKKITLDNKQYLKMLIWLTDNNQSVLKNFEFKLFLKKQEKLLQISSTENNDIYFINDNNFLEFYLPVDQLNKYQNEFIFSFSHDNFFQSQGSIFVDTTLKDQKMIDNELIIFQDNISHSLVSKNIDYQFPKIFLNSRYEELFKFKVNYETFNYFNSLNNKAILDLYNLIIKDVWQEAILIQDFQILIENNSMKNYYDFQPDLTINKINDEYKIMCNNFTDFNPITQMISDLGDKKGLVFNQTCEFNQLIKLNINIYEQEFNFLIPIIQLMINYDYFSDECLMDFTNV